MFKAGKRIILIIRRILEKTEKPKIKSKPKEYSPKRHYNKSLSPMARAGRSNFSAVVQFAIYINSQPQLKRIWKQSKIKGSTAYNKIIKTNIPLTLNQKLSKTNIIVPRLKYDLPSLIIDLNSICISLTVYKLKEYVGYYKMEKCTFQFVFVFSNPLNKTNNYYSITGFSEIITEINNADFNSSFALPVEIKTLIARYNNLIVYFTIIGHEESRSKPGWFSSFAKSFDTKVLSTANNFSGVFIKPL
jgi:hypothetical protein